MIAGILPGIEQIQNVLGMLGSASAYKPRKASSAPSSPLR